MTEPIVKRGALSFKGDRPPSRGKPSHNTLKRPSDLLRFDFERANVTKGDGRILANGYTIQGMETNFKDQVQVGDIISIRHPRNSQKEYRSVINILSQRSLNINQPFSSDFVSTTEFEIKKLSRGLVSSSQVMTKSGHLKKEEQLDPHAYQDERNPIDEGLEDAPAPPQKKSAITLEEKTGNWNKKTVSIEVDGGLTQEEILDIKCREVHDKYC
jgi:hypothetical protein